MPRCCVARTALVAAFVLHESVAAARRTMGGDPAVGLATEASLARYTGGLKLARLDAADIPRAFAAFCDAGGLALLIGKVSRDSWASLMAECPVGHTLAVKALLESGLKHIDIATRQSAVALSEDVVMATVVAQPRLAFDCVVGMRQTLTDSDADVRKRSVKALQAIASAVFVDSDFREFIVDELAVGLRSDMPEVRMESARSLGKLGLASTFGHSTRALIIERLAEALHNGDGPAHVSLATMGFSHELDIHARELIIETLAEALVKAASAGVRESSIEVLETIAFSHAIGDRSRSHIVRSLTWAAHDHDANVRRSALRALTRIARADAIDNSLREHIFESLMHALHDDRHVRIESVMALAKVGSADNLCYPLRRRIIDQLLQFADGVGMAAAHALGRIGSVDVLDALLRERIVKKLRHMSSDRDAGVREEAILALGKVVAVADLGDRLRMLILEILMQAFDGAGSDEEGNLLRVLAAGALFGSGIGPADRLEDAVRFLSGTLGAQGDDYLVAQSAQELGKIGLADAIGDRSRGLIVERLFRALLDDGVIVAAEALGKMASSASVDRELCERIIEGLAEVLSGREHHGAVRIASAAALEDIAAHGVLDGHVHLACTGQLMQGVSDEEQEVRAASARALGYLGNSAAIDGRRREQVVERLRSVFAEGGSKFVRAAAAGSLAKLERGSEQTSEDVVLFLVLALSDGDVRVRLTSAQALAQLGSEGILLGDLRALAIERLTEAAMDIVHQVKKAATGALWEFQNEA
mmetsp:Transcript_22564/g.65014  ORF Transcript_22564/g.65014 Transcript_22564/m.65014 type:complete len:763 (-) Transcript_22564:265-2553(-)